MKNNLNSREEFQRWLVNIHNQVNKLHKKKQYTYEEVKQLYTDIYAGKKQYLHDNISQPQVSTQTINLLLCLVVALFAFIVLQNYKFIFKKIKRCK